MLNIRQAFILLYILTIEFSSIGQSPFFKSIALQKSGQALSVSHITQDLKGYIWLSTSKGLMRFNGLETVVYGASDSLDESPVSAIYEDKTHTIWIGHKNGTIEFLQDGVFKKFRPEEGMGTSEITFITTDMRGVMWFGTLGEGVYYYTGVNRKRLYNLNNDDGLNDNYIYSFAQHNKGNIFLGTDNGICIIDQKTYKVLSLVTMRNGLPDNIVKHLAIDGNRLWVGMDEKGICVYNTDTKQFIEPDNWKYGTLSSFVLRNNEECWVSTKNNGFVKLLLYNNKLISHKQYTRYNGLPSDETIAIYKDRESNIWGGCPNGLFLSAASSFEFIDKKSEGFDFGNTFNFISDSYGHYWAATEKGLIRLIKDYNGKFTFEKVLSGNPHLQSSFISLYQDSMGYIWAGTYGYGVFRINPTNLNYTNYTSKNGLSDDNILQITGNGKEVWLASAGGGAVVYDLIKKTFTTYNTDKGLGSNYLYAVCLDSKGNKWFALDGKGVSVLKGQIIITDFLPDSLGINTVYSVVEDKYGTIWFLTADKGLLQYKNNKFAFYSNDKNIISNNIRSIIADNSGNLIIVSNETIQIYLGEENAIESFGSERGVAYLEPNLNGISSDHEGNIWIATSQGVIKYNPQYANQSILNPQISITKKLLFFAPISGNKQNFKYNENHLTFEYNGFWYQANENLQYRYKLENYDFDWSRHTTSRAVTYSNLPAGRYTFRVEVSHKPGEWIGSKDAMYSFTVKPPFYKTWWFITLSIITIIGSVLYYIKSRTAKLLKAKEELELEVKKRTATIQLQKEEIETQRDEIEAQRDFVTKQRDKISLQNDHITSGIQYASRIQNALLPLDEDYKKYFKEIFILNRPMEIVSGDFYWFTEKSGRIFVVAADCTGHGVSGAFMSILGISMLNKIVNSDSSISAAEVLNLLREDIKIALRQTGKVGETQDGMDIAIVIIESDKKKYQMAGANNAVYLVRNQELIQLRPDKMPIGIYLLETPFNNNIGKLEKDDILYLFSDGYYDQLGGPDDSKFKSRKFQELVLKISHLPFHEQKAMLDNIMNEWKAGRPQNDDILVIGFTIT
jgi:ligand-binding sensor domain-containing protein/serine phosphatase RsbU (regulator of sigma subunit)